MDILLLGGPRFLGLAFIEAALAAGHNVSTFNRGQTNPGLYPDIEKLRGDRDGDLAALTGRRWDAVIDTSGYVPRIVRQSAQLLAGNVGRYAFVSSISAYRDLNEPGIDEGYPLARLRDETVEEITGETYGGLKVLCERAVQGTFGDQALIIRPGLIVGPHDPTNRFTYWVTRAARGGRMLAPAAPDYQIQIIDARDLAEWIVRLIETNTDGVYNATGPDYCLTIGDILDTAKEVSGSDAEIAWASEEFLLASGVTPWSDIPLWAPAGVKVHQVNVDRALAAGLTFRPLLETVRDTLVWAQAQTVPDPPTAGLTIEREAQLLAALSA